MKEQRIIVWAMERLGIATAYGNRTQATDWLDRATPASCGFVAYNPFMPARIGWENYTIYVGGEDDMAKARILEGELTKWFKVRYEQYPRYSGNHVMMNVSVRARAHHIGMFGGGGHQEPDALNFYMPNGGTITLTRTGNPTAVTLEYTLDGGATWQTWTESGTTRTLTLNAGEKVYIRNTSDTSTGFSTGNSNLYQFAFSDTTEGDGNTNSLLCKNPSDAVLTSYCYRSLFLNASNLVTAPEIPSTILAEHCYRAMFAGCSLQQIPNLPAMTLADNCYNSMFYNCQGITEVVLPATTLVAYCYAYMFESCQNLNKISLHAENIATNSLYRWLNGVAATGDFYCQQSLNIPLNDVSGIPTGWTRHDL